MRDALHRITRGLHRRHGRWSEADIARVAAALERVAEVLERDGDD